MALTHKVRAPGHVRQPDEEETQKHMYDLQEDTCFTAECVPCPPHPIPHLGPSFSQEIIWGERGAEAKDGGLRYESE